MPTGVMSLEPRGAAHSPLLAAHPTSPGSVFQLLRDGVPRTRADLAAQTGLARSTVSARVDELLGASLIAPFGENSSTGGRPPATFSVNPAARCVVAVDLGGTHARIAVTDLAGEVLAEEELELAIDQGPVPVLDTVSEIARRLLAEAGWSPEKLIGIGIGLPGPVEFATGKPTSPPIMPGWDGFDVPAHLRRTFDVPILVDNDVNAMVLGEHDMVYPDVDHMMFVKTATGVGAGIISDSQLQHGAQGAAGDLGHVAVPDGDQTPCTCGNLGCLEAVASGAAIVARLREQGFDVTGQAEMVELVRSADPAAVRTVRQAGRQVGAVLASCVNLLNPSVIVIGGLVSTAGEHFLAGIRESVYSRSLPLATQHLRIVGTVTSGRAGVLGASAMVTTHTLSAEHINAMLAGSGPAAS
ncbi:ROK family transcriptional regulator [Garicola koreensis]|nr:ROK family transcriptional regulator [Garicola koreensis]